MLGVNVIKKYRNEWKYILTNQEFSLLNSRLSQVLELDSHTSKDGRYIIHSLYFDDYKDLSISATEAGLSNRFKWRIRYYGDDLDYIVLEKKTKKEGRCHKKSCRLTIDEYHYIINGDICDILYDTDKELIKELGKDMLMYHYQPKVIIDYERVAYVEEVTNVRITFDLKISSSLEIEHFLDGDYLKYYILPSNENILEIKFDDILPSYIRKIVESFGFLQTSFSKYYYGRKIIDSFYR